MRMAVAHLNELWTKVRMLPYGRILGVMVVAMLSAIATLALFASKKIDHLCADVRARQELKRHPPPPVLPTGEDLVDDQKLQAALAEYPDKSFELLMSRARTLCQLERWADSLATYHRAELASSAKRGLEDQLAYAEDLFHLRRFDEAVELLTALDLHSADAKEQAEVVSALARAHLASRQKDQLETAPSTDAAVDVKPVEAPAQPPKD